MPLCKTESQDFRYSICFIWKQSGEGSYKHRRSFDGYKILSFIERKNMSDKTNIIILVMIRLLQTECGFCHTDNFRYN